MIEPLFMRFIIDRVLLNASLDTPARLARLQLAGAAFLAAILLSNLIGVIKDYRQRLLNVRVMLSLRRSLFERLLHLPLAKLWDMKTGGILSRLTGDVDTTTGVFDPSLDPFTTGEIIIESIEQKMPWKLRAGIRYADRFAPRPTGTGRWEADPSKPEVIHDPLQDEHWDIELDVEYQMNSRNEEQVITYQINQGIFAQGANGGAINSTIYPADPNDPTTRIEKHWKDQISARLGGSLNVVPGVFAVSAGTHYETSGVTPEYMQIDFWPVTRVGLHGGVLLRVAKSIDLVFSYAHIFQETIIVAPPAHKLRGEIDVERVATGGRSRNIDKTVGVLITREGEGQMVLEEPSQGAPDGTARLNQVLSRTAAEQPPWVINAGRYRSNFDILAIGVNVHF